MPSDWSKQTHYSTDPAVMGLDRAMVALYSETGERRFLNFCVEERSLLTWNLGIVIGRRELMEGDASAYFSKMRGPTRLVPPSAQAGTIAAVAATGSFSGHRRRNVHYGCCRSVGSVYQ